MKSGTVYKGQSHYFCLFNDLNECSKNLIYFYNLDKMIVFILVA